MFVQVLRLCAAAGLTTLATVAIDGTKIETDAALDANRSAAAITAEVDRIMGEAAGADDRDEPLFGCARGDELPAELAQPASRLAWLSAALAQLQAQEAAARAASSGARAKAEAASAGGRKVHGRKPEDPAAALARAQTDAAAAQVRAQAKQASREAKQAEAAARGPRPPAGPRHKRGTNQAALAAAQAATAAAPPAKAAQANVTDPDSRIMKTAQGYLQGYNALAAVNEHQVVVGADVTQQGNDCLQLVPMMETTARQLAAAGADHQIGLVLADAGYWSDADATAAGSRRQLKKPTRMLSG